MDRVRLYDRDGREVSHNDIIRYDAGANMEYPGYHWAFYEVGQERWRFFAVADHSEVFLTQDGMSERGTVFPKVYALKNEIRAALMRAPFLLDGGGGREGGGPRWPG